MILVQLSYSNCRSLISFPFAYLSANHSCFAFDASVTSSSIILKSDPIDWTLSAVTLSLREKCPNVELFLVRIFLYSDWIRRLLVNLHIQSKYRKIRTKNNSVFGHFSRSFNGLRRPLVCRIKWRHANVNQFVRLLLYFDCLRDLDSLLWWMFELENSHSLVSLMIHSRNRCISFSPKGNANHLIVAFVTSLSANIFHIFH